MATLHGAPLPKDFEDNNPLTAAEFNAVKDYWVVDELPDTAEDGDVVFVIGDKPVGGELPGLGGWATIEEVSGTFTKHIYGDWVAYQWTGDGKIKSNEGVFETLLVGAGHGGSNGTNQGAGARPQSGAAGVVIYGVFGFESGEKNVTIGTTAYGKAGTESSLEGAYSPAQGSSSSTTMGGSQGAGGPATDPTPGAGHASTTLGGPGLFLDITGNNEEYAKGGDCAGYSHTGDEIPVDLRKDSSGKYGWGASQWVWSSANNGKMDMDSTGGTVVIRVPAANAQNVIENYYRWISYATVENGVVTSVNKTPDNLPYTAAVDEVPCGPEVSEGWNYDGSEFVAPEPDYSDQIKQLEEQLQTLRGAK